MISQTPLHETSGHRVLICGSLAYDTIMLFEGHFHQHILPNKIHALNVAFYTPVMRREFGGTAGNIAYNLNMLHDSPFIMATVGSDFEPYARWLETNAIATTYIKHIADSYTAQAFITTDLDNNQITAFHPGAMSESHQNSIAATDHIKLAVIAPDARVGMLQHARECSVAGIPFLFDPGQGLPMFSPEELLNFIREADYLAVNEYEAHLLSEKTGQSIDSLARQLKALVVTLGEQGSTIYADDSCIHIPCARVKKVRDPTGCGDAYRAGLIYGICRDWSWQDCGRLGAVLAGIKVEYMGGQNHHPSLAEIEAKFLNL